MERRLKEEREEGSGSEIENEEEEEEEAMLRIKPEGRNRKRKVCYCMCQRERERHDALCRETDGVCAPAGMKGGGGGQERVEMRRRRRRKKRGGVGHHLPSETKETECENVRGGGRKNKLSGSVTLLRSDTVSTPILPVGAAVVPWWDSYIPVFKTLPVILVFQTLPVIPEFLCLCNPLVPNILLIPESRWFRNTFGFQNPYDSTMHGYNPIPRKE